MMRASAVSDGRRIESERPSQIRATHTSSTSNSTSTEANTSTIAADIISARDPQPTPQPRHTSQTPTIAMGGCWPRLAPQPRPTPPPRPSTTVSTTPTYADLRGSPDLLTQRVWANVFLEEAEEEVEYNREEGKVEEESEEGD